MAINQMACKILSLRWQQQRHQQQQQQCQNVSQQNALFVCDTFWAPRQFPEFFTILTKYQKVETARQCLNYERTVRSRNEICTVLVKQLGTGFH